MSHTEIPETTASTRRIGWVRILLPLLAVACPLVAPAQVCTWEGASTLELPAATYLRSQPTRAPGRIAIDDEGRVYVADPTTGTVVVRDRLGRIVSEKNGLQSPTGIAVDASGAIYVAEQDQGSVTVFDPGWTVQTQLGQGQGEFLLPNDIAIDPDPAQDAIYVSDGRAHVVAVYSFTGARVRTLGGRGSAAGLFDFPAAVWVSAAGEVFVADQNNDRVQVFDRNGSFQRCIGTNAGSSRRFGRILDLTGDSAGRVYVTDGFQGHVMVLDPLGVQLGAIGGFGSGAGELRTPVGIAIDDNNRLFVASHNSGRVDVFGVDEFSDPILVGAVVAVAPDPIDWSDRTEPVIAYLELAQSLDDVILSSVTANGVPAENLTHTIGDHDDDGVPDLMLQFGWPFWTTVRPGEATVTVRGELMGGSEFEGSATLTVVGGRPPSPQRSRPLRRGGGLR